MAQPTFFVMMFTMLIGFNVWVLGDLFQGTLIYAWWGTFLFVIYEAIFLITASNDPEHKSNSFVTSKGLSMMMLIIFIAKDHLFRYYQTTSYELPQ